jgi:tetratricopeptide (TPR) repeat protein
MMKVAPFALAALVMVSACSQRVRVPSASERAQQLNAAKERAAGLLDAGAYRRAAEELEALAEKASGDPQVFTMLGDAHAGLDEYDQAVAAYESALRLAYTDHEAHLKLATFLMRHQRVGRALTEFELAIEYGDKHPLTHYNYGLALREMGRDEEALVQWRRAYDMAPSDARYAEAVAIGLSGVDDEEALAFFGRAGRLGADTPSFHNNYGLSLQRAGRFEEAEVQFLAAVSGAPEEEGYRFNLAALLMAAERFQRAANEWEALVEQWGKRWSYGVYLGRALLQLERYSEALAAVSDLPGLRLGREGRDRTPPRRHEAYEILALASRGAGDLDSARRYMARAVELAPDNLMYRNNYGVILAESGMLAEAKAQWRSVLESDAGNTAARENLSRFGP